MLTSLDSDRWIVVDDGVMGGRSDGHVGVRTGHDGARTLVFHGELRTQGGGFTSIRSLGLDRRLDGCEEVVLTVRGDGRRYACDLREGPRLRGFEPTWKAEFDTTADTWATVVLPLDDFVPTHRGRRLDRRHLEKGTPFWTRMGSVGVTIADGIDGPFELEIATLEAR